MPLKTMVSRGVQGGSFPREVLILWESTANSFGPSLVFSGVVRPIPLEKNQLAKILLGIKNYEVDPSISEFNIDLDNTVLQIQSLNIIFRYKCLHDSHSKKSHDFHSKKSD